MNPTMTVQEAADEAVDNLLTWIEIDRDMEDDHCEDISRCISRLDDMYSRCQALGVVRYEETRTRNGVDCSTAAEPFTLSTSYSITRREWADALAKAEASEDNCYHKPHAEVVTTYKAILAND